MECKNHFGDILINIAGIIIACAIIAAIILVAWLILAIISWIETILGAIAAFMVVMFVLISTVRLSFNKQSRPGN